MHKATWLLLATCVACGDANLRDGTASSPDSEEEASLTVPVSHQFGVKSAAFDYTDTGLTRSVTLYVSNQNNVCRDVLENRQHKGEHRLGMVGMTGGDTRLTTRYCVADPRTPPRAGTAILVVPEFDEFDGQCANLAPRIVGGTLTIFDLTNEEAGAAYSLVTSDHTPKGILGAVTATYCKGLRRVRADHGYRTCAE